MTHLSAACIGDDPLCPCQDGMACHYVDSGGTKGWPVPPTKHLRPREIEALALLDRHGPMKRGQIAVMMGCAPATAGQHLWLCKRAGKAHSRGVGYMAVWHPGPASDNSAPAAARDVQQHLASVWR